MKPSLLHTAIVCILFTSVLFSQEPVATISPSSPQVGDSITIIYNFAAPNALLKEEKNISAEVRLLSHQDWKRKLLSLPMTQAGSRRIAGFRLVDSACLILVRFVSGELLDDNNQKQWKILVCDRKGMPVRFAHYYLATLYKQGGGKGCQFDVDSTRFLPEMKEELKLHGNDPEVRVRCLLWMRSLNTDEDTEISYDRQIDSLYREHQADNAFVEILLPYFDLQGSQRKADSIRADWMRQNPQGLLAREERFKEIEKTQMDDSSFYGLLCKYVESFPSPIEEGHDMRLRELYLDLHFSHLCVEKKPDEAIKLYEALPDKQDEFLNNLVLALAQNGVETKRMFMYADTMLARARDTTYGGYDSRKTMSWYKQRQEIMSLHSIGMGMTTLGRHADALAAYREAYEKSDSSDTWLNTDLLRSYLVNDKWDEALRFGVACIRNETAGDSIPLLLRAEIRKQKGSDAQLDSLIKPAIEEAAKKVDADLERSRLNLPYDPCSMMTLDGAAVDLKSYLGKVVILDFWATWCAPCRTAMPMYQKYYESVKNDPRIVVLSVNVWETGTRRSRIERVRKFIQDSRYTFPVILGDDCNKTFQITGVPTMVIIDPKGRIQFNDTGQPLTDSARNELNKRVDFLLKEK